jgi:hypothetical protein
LRAGENAMTDPLAPSVLARLANGEGDRAIARALSAETGETVTRHRVRSIERAALRRNGSAAPVAVRSATAAQLYDAACRALDEAKSLVDVKDVINRTAALKELAALRSDRTAEIAAAELRILAEHRLGTMLIATELSKGGRPRKGVPQINGETPATLAELGIDPKTSARSQALAHLPDDIFTARLAAWREGAKAQDGGRIAYRLAKGGPIAAHRAVAANRVQPDDSLDYFPTPPWATRTLMEVVLRRVDSSINDRPCPATIWEPACGEGHMSEVIKEYCPDVMSTDLFEGYGYGHGGVDFLDYGSSNTSDWIITNPPFRGKEDRALAFALRALDLARHGVALFVRTQWAIEGVERYERLFRDRPPTLVALFSERVNLCEGRWDPDGATLTAYCWLVWVRERAPLPLFYIAPGCRKALTRPDDRARFAAWSIA